jgi:hypothetical protein
MRPCRTSGRVRVCWPRFDAGTLAFSIEGSIEPVYLHAWAEQAGHERTWYFAGDDAARIDPLQDTRMLGRGIVLDAAPGVLRVNVVVARRKLAREALLSPPPDVTRSVVEIEVTP